MNPKQTTLALWGLSLLFFLRKGVQYAVLGSYLPLAFALLFTLVLGLSLSGSPRIFHLSARIWGILLIAWAVIRLFFSVLTIIIKPLKEYHLTQQFGVAGMVLSIGVLLVGIWLLRSLPFLRKHQSGFSPDRN
jgi:hypothetical protein